MATPRRARVEATGERAVVTPLELFFDLVFVFALTQVTDLMAEDPTVGQVVRGVLVLGVLWWCWAGFAWLGNIARADEGIIRVAMFFAMGAVFVAAITIPEAFDDLPGGLHGPMVFALCYLSARWCTSHVLARQPGRPRPAARCCGGSRAGGGAPPAPGRRPAHRHDADAALARRADRRLVGALLAGNSWRLASAGHFAERHGLIILIALASRSSPPGSASPHCRSPGDHPGVAARAGGLGGVVVGLLRRDALITERALAAAAAPARSRWPATATRCCTCR